MKQFAIIPGAFAILLLVGCGPFFSQARTDYAQAIKETPRSWVTPVDSAGIIRSRVRGFLIREGRHLTVDRLDRIEAEPASEDSYGIRLVITIAPEGDALRVTVAGSGRDPEQVEITTGELAFYARTGRDLTDYQRGSPD